jgi:hypothetical protein
MTRRRGATGPDGGGRAAAARRDSKRRPAAAPASEIQHALDYIRQQITEGKLRPTINDLVRLLEIRQCQNPTEIIASWYNPNEAADTCPVCHRPNTLKCPKCGHQEKAEPYDIPYPTPPQEEPA